MRKWITRGSLVLCLGVVAFILNLISNPGLPFGYYGELNRLTAGFESLPGITIENVGSNADITLEEITFWILDAQGFRHQIHFGENDPIRRLSGEELRTALAQRIAK